MLAAMIEEWGAKADLRDPVPDNRERLTSAVAHALDSCDIVVVNAGSSAGSEDHTARVVEELGQLLRSPRVGEAADPSVPAASRVWGCSTIESRRLPMKSPSRL